MPTHNINEQMIPVGTTLSWRSAALPCWLVLFVCTSSLFAQGNFDFNNLGINGSPYAPVYGPELDNPHLQKWGNPPEANPPGTQVYGGELLGVDHRVEAWYSVEPATDIFALYEGASAVAGTLTPFLGGLGAGYFSVGNGRIENPPLDGVYMQVRAWDTEDGNYLSWDEAWTAAQAGGGNAVGWSKVFPQPLAFGAAPPEGLRYFESFNIFIVPEPSSLALVGLGGLLLWMFRRNRSG